MTKAEKIIKKISQKPGVYLFRDKSGRILYVGKTLNLRNRVRSHFQTPRLGRAAHDSRPGNNLPTNQFIKKVSDIDWIVTDDEKQALLLENELIKRYQPRYNIQWRDDKSYFWVIFTNEEWPRLLVTHQKQLLTKNYKLKTNPIGPLVNGRELKSLLRALRKILPYRTCKNPYNKPCLQWHLGLCPTHRSLGEGGPAHQNPPQSPFTKGGSSPLLKRGAKGDLKNYLNSLNALAQFLKLYAGEPIRIEAYDISNIHGVWATGSMIVFYGAKPQKSDYRRFKIKNVRGANDVAMIKEVLRRRLGHPEWPTPDLILIDGGIAQLHAARLSLVTCRLSLNIIALAKQQEEIYTEYGNKALKLSVLPIELKLIFQTIRNEAHRFAIFYYRHLHRKTLKKK